MPAATARPRGRPDRLRRSAHARERMAARLGLAARTGTLVGASSAARFAGAVAGERGRACTNAAITGLCGSASGCHCTPSTNRAGQLDRLRPARPRTSRRRLTISPAPRQSTPWWWWDLVAWTSSPAALAASEPATSVDLVVGAVEGADHAAVLLVAEVVGQVLDQRAAAGDVDQLHPAADPEHRQVARDRRARERDFEARRARGPCPTVCGCGCSP